MDWPLYSLINEKNTIRNLEYEMMEKKTKKTWLKKEFFRLIFLLKETDKKSMKLMKHIRIDLRSS